MTISISCPRCDSKLKAKDSLAGKRIACPKCKEPIQIPVPMAIVEADFDDPVVLDDKDNLNGLPGIDFSFPDPSSVTPTMSNLPDMQMPTELSAPSIAQSPKQPQRAIATTAVSAPNAVTQKSNLSPALLVTVASASAVFLIVVTVTALAWALRSPASTSSIAQNPTSELASSNQPVDAAVKPSNTALEPTTNTSNPTNPLASSVKTTPLKSSPGTPTVPVPQNASSQNDTPQPAIDLNLETQFAACTVIEVSQSSKTQRCLGLLVVKSAEGGLVITSSNLFASNVGTDQAIFCTFRPGTGKEVRAPAKIDAVDEDLNLAILRVTHQSLPQAFPFKHLASIGNEQQFTSFGVDNTNPNPTSALRTLLSRTEHSCIHPIDSFPERTYLWRMTSTTQTNTIGSPFFDSQGKLAGLFVSRDPDNDQIAFAISADDIASTLDGRVAKVERRIDKDAKSIQTISFELELIDPLKNITQVEIQLYPIPSDTASSQVHYSNPPPDGSALDIPCRIKHNTAVATIPWEGKPDSFHIRYQVKGRNAHLWRSSYYRLTDEKKVTDGIVRNLGAASNRRSLFVRSGDRRTTAAPTKLRAKMADFAFNPNNGDLAAVDPTGNEVVLFSIPYPVDGSPTRSIPVGSKPSAIAFKKFGNIAYYAVICNENKSLVLIDATDFTLKKEIPFPMSPGYSIASLEDENDPFLLISSGSTEVVGNSMTYSIDLRQEPSAASIFGNGISYTPVKKDQPLYAPLTQTARFSQFPISYVKKPRSKPYFGMLNTPCFKNETSFKIDPKGLYVSNRNNILTHDLKHLVGFVDFVPMCFLKEKPLIVGLDGSTLRAASYNTFQPTKGTITVPLSESAIKEVNQAFKLDSPPNNSLIHHTRMFADEKNAKIIVASQDDLYLIPLASLSFDDEPFLLAQCDTKTIKVGETTTVTVAPYSDKVELKFLNVPTGATVSGQTLEWQPTIDQVGKHVVSATLKYGKMEQETRHNIIVEHPYIELNGQLSASSYNEKENLIVSPSSQRSYAIEHLTEEEIREVNEERLVSVHSLKPNFAKRTIPESQGALKVYSDSTWIVVYKIENEQGKLVVYKYPSLEMVRVIPTSERILDIQVIDKTLMVIKPQKLDTYDTETLKLRHSMRLDVPPTLKSASSWPRSNIPINIPKDGILSDGILLDPQTNVPKLCCDLQAFAIPKVVMKIERPTIYNFLRTYRPTVRSDEIVFNKQVKVERTPIPGSEWTVHWEKAEAPRAGNKESPRPVEGTSIYLVFSPKNSDQAKRVLLANSEDPPGALVPTFAFTNNSLLAEWKERTYIINLDFTKQAQQNPSVDQDTEEFYFEPKQSQLVVNTGKVSLKHELIGGKAPFEYSTIIDFPGMRINKQSGVVTLDLDTIVNEHEAELLQPATTGRTFQLKNSDEIIRDWSKHREKLNDKLNLKLRGVPLAIPIYIRATDDTGITAQLFYYVIADVNVRQIKKLLEK